MSPNRLDKYREWDAVYVLGSLVPSERREFEEHLAGCARCRAAVAELAGLPSLLGTLSAEEAQALERGGDTRASELPALGEAVRRRRQRMRLAVAGLVLGASAASGAVTLAVIVPATEAMQSAPPAKQSQSGSVSTLNFTAVVANPLAAKGSIAGQEWGTRIDWECSYRTSPTGYPSSPGTGVDGTAEKYALVVVDSRGITTQVASWTADPGMVVMPTATTSIPAADIRRVEIRAVDSGLTLLRARL